MLLLGCRTYWCVVRCVPCSAGSLTDLTPLCALLSCVIFHHRYAFSKYHLISARDNFLRQTLGGGGASTNSFVLSGRSCVEGTTARVLEGNVKFHRVLSQTRCHPLPPCCGRRVYVSGACRLLSEMYQQISVFCTLKQVLIVSENPNSHWFPSSQL